MCQSIYHLLHIGSLEKPIQRKTGPVGASFSKNPHRPSVGVLTLSWYRAGWWYVLE